MNIILQLEALLFVASKPLTIESVAKSLGVKKNEINTSLDVLKNKFNKKDSGICIVMQGTKIQMVSSPDASEVVEKFVKKEITGDLTRPQLETLAIVAYRGPINKPHIEELRGVNCSLILRNLMIRGLVEESRNKTDDLPEYVITIEFLNHMGLNQPQDLPKFKELNVIQHEKHAD